MDLAPHQRIRVHHFNTRPLMCRSAKVVDHPAVPDSRHHSYQGYACRVHGHDSGSDVTHGTVRATCTHVSRAAVAAVVIALVARRGGIYPLVQFLHFAYAMLARKQGKLRQLGNARVQANLHGRWIRSRGNLRHSCVALIDRAFYIEALPSVCLSLHRPLL